MNRDKLFLIKPGFIDPAYPEQTFYCWHCALIEGVLSAFPDLSDRIDVERVEWSRPRSEVVELLGVNNQSLPALVLCNGETSAHQTGVYLGRSFVSDKNKILATLSERHGFPSPHP